MKGGQSLYKGSIILQLEQVIRQENTITEFHKELRELHRVEKRKNLLCETHFFSRCNSVIAFLRFGPVHQHR